MKILSKFLVIIGFLTLAKFSSAYEYPIAELGNCRDRQECHAYCEVPTHKAACWSYSTYRQEKEVLGEETPEAKLAALGITFPIEELGNCVSITQCRGYCNLAGTERACQAFAQRHGLLNQEAIIAKAQETLGCATREACRAVCDDPNNHEQCTQFAEQYNLVKVEPKIISQAQIELGCRTSLECFNKCELPQNQDVCQRLAQTSDIPIRNTQIAQNISAVYKEELTQHVAQTLGCGSFSDCRNTCEQTDNKQKCKELGETVKQKVIGLIIKKGDCQTADECRRVCQINPSICPGFPAITIPRPPSGSAAPFPQPTDFIFASSPSPEIPPTQPVAPSGEAEPFEPVAPQPSPTPVRPSPSPSKFLPPSDN